MAERISFSGATAAAAGGDAVGWGGGSPAQRGDPYYVARDELHAAVEDLLREAAAWRQQRGGASAAAGLRSTAEELLEDLQTIEKSVDAAERHAAKFNVSPGELHARRLFVEQQRKTLVNVLQQLADEVQLPTQQHNSGQPRRPAATASGNAAAAADSSTRHGTATAATPPAASFGSAAWHTTPRGYAEHSAAFSETHHRQQQEMLLRQQDFQLEELSQSAERLHETACTINRELEDQQRMLNELDEDLDQQTMQMNFLMRRMGRLLKTSNVRQLCLIIWLTCLALLLFVLLIIT